MKYFTKTSIVFAFFAIVVLIACESKPTTPNSLLVKRWVLGKVANDDSYLHWYDIFDEFDTKDRIKKYIPIDYVPKSKNMNLQEYCEVRFEYGIFPCDMSDKSNMVTNLKKDLDQQVEIAASEKRRSETAKKIGAWYKGGFGLNEDDRKIVEEICTKLIDEFDTFFSNLVTQKLTVLDCVPGPKLKTKDYQAYWVTYEFGSGFYILAYYTEFTDRYRMEIKYQGESLADLSTYLK